MTNLANLKNTEQQSIGALIDRYAGALVRVDAIEADLQTAKKTAFGIEIEILNRFSKDDLDGAVGMMATATISKREHYSIADRALINAYAKENDALDLFQARLNSQAVKARLEAGEQVPGVKLFTSVGLKLKPNK